MENFDKNIFINCPFDDAYYSLLRPIIFTVIYCGYIPRIAIESSDSGKPRIEKLKELIQVSKYSIHDLSRIKSNKKNEFYRLNMPFELGLDFGCRCYSSDKQSAKEFLILEKDRFRYMKALSDINGFDIKSHDNSPENVVREVRNWFVETIKVLPKSPSKIWGDFNDFYADLQVEKEKEGYTQRDIDFMTVPELTDCMKKWLKIKNILNS